MTEAQIKHMVDRFLGWKLPESFNPDGGIVFKKTFNGHLPQPMKHEPSGTNLFDATQADAMVRYMLEGMPSVSPEISGQEAIQMMNRCKDEIMSLRARIDRLQPKADAYDNLATVLRLLPQPSQGMGEDLVWRLNKRIQELAPKPAQNPAS